MSDLLNSAYLVLIPSGYKEGKAFSAVPTDGSGDLSFSRSSNGTRVNSAGLVEVCPWNLAQYSETFTNAFWSVDNGSITANSTTAPNGTATADTLTRNASTAYLYNGSFNLGIGEFTQSIYAKANASSSIRLEFVTAAFGRGAACIFDLSNGTAGSITIYGGVSGFTASIENVGNGWYRCSIGGTLTIADTYYYEISITTGSIYIWGAQLNIGSTAKPYFPTTDRLNVPRLTYQNGGCPSLLLEKQSTNLVTYSEQFDQWNTQDASVTANQITSPDGTQNADKIVENNQNQVHYIYSNTGTYASADYTVSVYAKAGERSILQLFVNGSTNINAFANFDLTNGVAYPTSSTATITAVGDGWYRCTITATLAAATLPLVYFAIQTSTSATRAQAYAGDGTSGLYLWGAQSEQSSYVTSLIQTTSASATRVADECQLPMGTLLAQSNWTIFFDHKIVGGEGGSAPIYSLYETSADNVFLYVNGNAGLNLYMPLQGGYVFGTGSNNGFVPNQRSKVLLKYNGTTIKYFINGVLYGSASATLTYTQRALYYETGGGKSFEVNETVFFPTALTDAECISLTTL